MSAETAKQFDALEAQARDLMGVFVAAGYEAVAPAIIQPAEVFLDIVGEDLRGRTYVFNDPEGAELCLRPDLTVPTCRLHFERFGQKAGERPARYCYNGPAFRFQPAGSPPAHPREYRQAGVELFGERDREVADVEITRLIVEALETAGLTDYEIRIGDVGIFHYLLEALDLPTRWRDRLRAHFWRPEAFRSELRQLTTRPAAMIDGLPAELVDTVVVGDVKATERAVSKYFEANDIQLIGARTLGEIAESLLADVEDAKAEALPESTAELIEAYLSVTAPARAAGARLVDLFNERGVRIDGALKSYSRRLQLLSAAGIDTAHVTFSAEFGRNIEYYTGYVFEVRTTALGPSSPVAGGGRYDRMMRLVGSREDVPAVGAMIHTERLLATVREASA